MKREKEKQVCILEILSRYIIHLKITKHSDSANKSGIPLSAVGAYTCLAKAIVVD